MTKAMLALMETDAPPKPTEPERDRLRRHALETMTGRDLAQYIAYLDSPLDPRD